MTFCRHCSMFVATARPCCPRCRGWWPGARALRRAALEALALAGVGGAVGLMAAAAIHG
ncbi:MAG TPA: hypothetical protein VFR81_25155 [Longimicrobium sp.]|nr:hypothetical protein [Longimicrobium sp.]